MDLNQELPEVNLFVTRRGSSDDMVHTRSLREKVFVHELTPIISGGFQRETIFKWHSGCFQVAVAPVVL